MGDLKGGGCGVGRRGGMRRGRRLFGLRSTERRQNLCKGLVTGLVWKGMEVRV
jgi:hypothetical protein